MKYINIKLNKCKALSYGLLISATMLTVSCNMERNPLASFSEDTFWTSEDNAMIALTGMYRGTLSYGVDYGVSDWWGYSATIIVDGVSDLGYDRRAFNNVMGKLTSGGILPTNGLVTSFWKNSYKRIEIANRFLENIDKVPMSKTTIERMKSEARFIRACQYFYLASYFGDIPLVTKLLPLEEANSVKKAPKAEVLNFVIAEFTDIAPLLPRQKDIPKSEIGRACGQAAYSFLGKAQVLAKNWKAAAASFKKIIDFGDSEIAPKYAELFYAANENSTENIFSTQYIDNLGGNGLPQHAYPVMKGGWCLVNPASGLVEEYEFKDGTPFSYTDSRYDPMNIGKNRDPRLDYTVYYNGASFKGSTYECDPSSTTSLDKIGAGQVTQTGYLMRKFFDEGWSGDVGSYGANIPIVRYSDVLLMYLECELEAGTAISQTMLDMTINKIRSRADVQMPPITDTDPTILREKIRHERKIELAFEGHRLWDLFRWGIAEKELNKDIYGAPFPYVKNQKLIKKKGGVADPYSRWYVNKRAFKTGQEIWPVPQAEQNINPNLR
ncbi:MAG: RagB/SusD family nutrient uptake outer membrane protein [Rikenellaceae bacterium]